MKHVGIVACSAEGAALCYRHIVHAGERLLGEYQHPKVTLHSIPMAKWMPAINARDQQAVTTIVLDAADVVTRAGADFLICPDNTVHLFFEGFVGHSSIPWLHIGDVVASEARRHGWRKAGVLGTKLTMRGPMYRETLQRCGIQMATPPDDDQHLIDGIIWNELVRGEFREPSRLRYNEIIGRLKQQGCECVILGCTEIPLLVRRDDCPLPTLDSTRLLAEAAVRYAVESDQ